ncbi:hypothetical protein PYJP_01180 [Pyrofollis japonicus]|nr:hypothetical protein PYJP_01180 [Pyrofollis japonicus]
MVAVEMSNQHRRKPQRANTGLRKPSLSTLAAVKQYDRAPINHSDSWKSTTTRRNSRRRAEEHYTELQDRLLRRPIAAYA